MRSVEIFVREKEGKMAPNILQKPSASHAKIPSTTVSIRTIARESSDDDEPAGRRRLEPINTNIGKRRGFVALVPQPSDDPRDPLNWSVYKKEAVFGSIMLSAAVVGILKTMFVTTNSVIAVSFSVSYVATASLTGVPFIFAAGSSVGASILAGIIGKRSIYTLGGILMLAGALGNMHAETFAQFMISRMFQGLGWGMTEGLIQESIRDLYFVHERNLRTNIYTLTSLMFTWGTPILGGHLSQSMAGFREEIMVLTLIQAFSVFFLIFFVPETSFARSSPSANLFGTTTKNTISGPSPSLIKTYLLSLKQISYHAPFSVKTALQPIRALGAPTTLLTFLLTFPLIATSYGIANSMSLLFATMPTFLFPTRLGFIFVFPALFSLLTFSAISVASFFRSRAAKNSSTGSNGRSLISVFPGIFLGVSGLLAFGLYTSGELSPRTVRAGSAFTLTTAGDDLSLKVVSALFGMLIASTIVLSYAASSHISAFSNTSTNGSDEKESLLEIGYHFWLNFFIGIFVIGVPAWIQMQGKGTSMMNGLRDTSIALAVMQLVVASTAGATLWVLGTEIRRMDRKIMGLGDESRGVGGSLELRRWDSKDSFFDA